MTELELINVLKCLSDKSRLRILRSLMKEGMYVERLAERLDLSAPTVSFHLKKLEEIGAVRSRKEQYYTVYSLCPEAVSFNVLECLARCDDNRQDERDEAYRNKVLSSFMEHGKLKSIPAQLKKRHIVLEEICKVFDFGRPYTEREVNIRIADFHDDFCTIRRDMIGAGLLERHNGIYTKLRERAMDRQ